MKIRFQKTPKGPTAEAVEALDQARRVRKRAEAIYVHREALLRQNHFADRIRAIYQGGS